MGRATAEYAEDNHLSRDAIRLATFVGGPFSFQAARSTRQRTFRCQHEELRREHRLDDPHATPSSCFQAKRHGGTAGRATAPGAMRDWTDSVPYRGTIFERAPR